jgi:hypothetical protein
VPAAADWSPGVGEALNLYRRGDLTGASQVVRAVAESTLDPATARDARVLRLLIDMRAEERPLQRDARAELAELGDADADLLTRPEVQQALGRAALAQFETTAAIDWLRKAADAFERRGMNVLAAQCWVGVAEAWATHGEWEITPRDWIDRRPRSPEEAQSLRIAKVMDVVENAKRLGTAGALAAEEIQLVLGQMYLSENPHDANGLEILDALASKAASPDVAALAAWELGVAAESAQQPILARRRYEQARRSPDPALAQRAAAAADRVAASPYELVFDALPDGVRVTVRTDAAHAHALRIEARPLDVAAWLQSRQGRWNEAAAPLGAVIAAAQDIPAAAPEDDAAQREQSVELSLAAGAYVISLHERPDGPPVARRVWLQSAPRLLVLVGAERAAVLCDADAGPACDGEFWIQGGFVPQRLQFHDGAAICPIAAEAQVLLTRRWSCVVRCGDRVAVAHGELPPAGAPFDVALRTGPDGQTAADEIRVAGALIDAWGRPARDLRNSAVSVELRNADGRSLLSADSIVRGPFLFATLPLNGLIAPDALHMVARQGTRTLALLDGRLPVATRLASLPMETTIDGPNTLSYGKPAAVRWQIRSAWDSPATGTRTLLRYSTIALPAPDRPAPERMPAFEERLELDAAGRASWDLPVDRYSDVPPPHLGALYLSTGVGAANSIARWRVLRPPAEAAPDADPRAVAWIHPVADAPAVGTPLFFSVGWIDTRTEILPSAPTVLITDPDGVETILSARLTRRGWRSDDFRPVRAGEHRATLRVPRFDHAPLTAECVWTAAAESPAGPKSPTLLAVRSADGAVTITVHDLSAEPGNAYWLGVGDESPVAAARISAKPNGLQTHTFRLPKGTPATLAWLIVARPSGAAERIWAAIEESEPAALSISVADSALNSGAAVLSANVAGARAGAGLLLLTRALDPDGPSTSGSGRTAPRPPPVFRLFEPHRDESRAATDAVVDFLPTSPLHGGWDEPLVDAQMVELPAARAASSMGGVRPAVEQAQIRIDLPAQAGVYRARLITQAADGRWLAGECLIDTRDRVGLTLDFPVRCVAGDQSSATILLSNPTRDPRDVTIEISVDGGALIGWREPDGRASPAEPRSVRVPPLEAVRIEALIEVSAGARGSLRVLATDDTGAITRLTRRFLVHPAAAPGGNEDLLVKRTLYRITLPPVPAPGVDRPPATLTPVDLDATLPEGTPLRVVEEITSTAPLRGVRWTQPLAGNLFAWNVEEAGELVQIGRRSNSGFDTYVWRTDELPAITVRHEYDVLTGRPGLCELPAPRVTAGNEARSVTVEGTVRLRVTRAPEGVGGLRAP